MSIFLILSNGPGLYGIAAVVLLGVLVSYIVYQRFFHPLASYPGPFLASITDLWQVFQFLSLDQPIILRNCMKSMDSSCVMGQTS